MRSGWPVTWLLEVYVSSETFQYVYLVSNREHQAAGATSLLFVYSLDYARTRLANDAKNSKSGGDRQFNGLVDVYKKTLKTDGIAGLYRGFGPSVLGIVVYRGLYFGMYDSIKPVLLVGPLEGNFLASFLLGWTVTTGAGIASYPLDTIRRRMMMTSGEVSNDVAPFTSWFWRLTMPPRPSSTSPRPTLPVKSSRRKVSSHFSRVPVPISSVVSPVLVCSPSTIKPSSSCSAKPSRVDRARFVPRDQNRCATTGWDLHNPRVQVRRDIRAVVEG